MRVQVGDTRIFFEVIGTKLVPEGPTMRERPTVVLLHGGPGSYDHSYLKPDFARLADVPQVVYLDLPGHGRSEWGDATTWSLELCPTLVCVGELDPITPISAAGEIVEAMPEADVRLEIVEGAGHFLWKDVPDRYWPLLTEFVAARQD